jgi:hypothetical protein
MRYHPQTYLDLTCCYTDRCNDQPGKIIKVVDSQLPIQHQPYQQEHHHHHYAHQLPQPSTTPQKPTQRYYSHVQHPTTTSRLLETYKPNSVNDKALIPSNSLSLNSFSNWMIVVTLFVALFAMRV